MSRHFQDAQLGIDKETSKKNDHPRVVKVVQRKPVKYRASPANKKLSEFSASSAGEPLNY